MPPSTQVCLTQGTNCIGRVPVEPRIPMIWNSRPLMSPDGDLPESQAVEATSVGLNRIG